MKKLFSTILVICSLLSNSANAKSIELKNCRPTWNAKNLYHTVGVKVDLDSFKIKTFNSDPDYLFIDGTYNIDASRTSSDDQLRNEKGLIYSKQYSAYNLLGGDQKKLMTGYKQASADYEIDLLDKTVTVIFKWDPNKLTRKEKKDLKKWGVNVKKVSTYKYACNSYFAKGFKKKEPKKQEPNNIPNISNSEWNTATNKDLWMLKENRFTIKFLSNGLCETEDIIKCVWEQDNRNLKFTYNNQAVYEVKLKSNSWEGKANNKKTNKQWKSYGEAISITSWVDIAEKPKQLPEDNKVVPAGSGSGFFVSSDGHIITNHHVINGCNTTKVSFKGNQIEAQILAVDKMNDIAILKTNIKPNSIFPISNEDVSLLEDVVVAGYPLGKQVSSAIKTHKGVVTALAGAGDNYSNFQTDASINAGNSGGPIMNQKGNIVGIAVATWVQDGVQGVHFGIKSSTLKTFANSNSLKFSQANNRELSNKDLGKLITEATVYLECHMTVANIKKMMAAANNRKAFFSEFK